MKTAEGGVSKGVDYYGLVKTSHKVFLLDTLERSTKECPGEYHLFMKSNPRVPGYRPLMEVGLMYN